MKPKDRPGRSSYYWEPCKGCKDGHPSFWMTVIESPQWNEWRKDVAERFHQWNIEPGWGNPIKNVWDIDECEACGIISAAHFQAFLKFCSKRPRSGGADTPK